MKENTEIIRQQTARDGDEMEIDLVELLYYFYSRAGWILAAFIAGGILLGLVTFFFVTPKYTATSKVYMVSANSDSILDLADPILEDVIDTLGLGYTYEALENMIEVSSTSETRILVISAESADPQEAKGIANRLALLAVSRLPDLMGTMEPSLIESAVTPKDPSSPSYTRNIMIGALLFALLVMAVLTFRFISDDTLKTTEDVEAAFGVLPLAVIPESDLGEHDGKEEKKHVLPGGGRRKKKKVKGEGTDGES